MNELRSHAPFTLFGALTGIGILLLFQKLPHDTAHSLFYTLHPLHVLVSAYVTTAMYVIHTIPATRSITKITIVGFIGSIGIATLSDSLLPFWGETLLSMPHTHAHIGFIEKWWLVNPLALMGIGLAFVVATTKVPHYTHVLLSTWASLFHIIMALGVSSLNPGLYLAVFVFLFVAVWLPCCLSDIIFPIMMGCPVGHCHCEHEEGCHTHEHTH